jgi:hypothetical protein
MSIIIKQKTSTAPVVSTSAYAAGDVIGSKISFADAARVAAGNGLVESILLHCKSNQTFAFDVLFFSADPAASTFTDNAALAVAAADFDKICGKVSFVSGDWASLGTPSVADKHKLQLPFKLTSGKTLYAVIVSRGTPTLASTSDLKLTLGVSQN